jgi:hypothetical protein
MHVLTGSAMLERLSSTDSNAADCIARARALAPLIAAHAAQISRPARCARRADAPDARLFRTSSWRVATVEADPRSHAGDQ